MENTARIQFFFLLARNFRNVSAKCKKNSLQILNGNRSMEVKSRCSEVFFLIFSLILAISLVIFHFWMPLLDVLDGPR